MQDYIYDQFQTVGNDLLRLGLTTSHGGNMSIRHQGNMVVTVHFAMLGRLDPGDRGQRGAGGVKLKIGWGRATSLEASLVIWSGSSCRGTSTRSPGSRRPS